MEAADFIALFSYTLASKEQKGIWMSVIWQDYDLASQWGTELNSTRKNNR